LVRARFVRFLSLAVVVSQLNACATIVHGRSQELEILSKPEGARVTIEPAGVELTTPGVVKLERKHDQLVTYELDGYEPRARQVTAQISGWFFVNLILGGLIGMAVDFGTGGAYYLEPDPVTVELKPIIQPGGTP